MENVISGICASGTKEVEVCMNVLDTTKVVHLRKEKYDVYIGRAGHGHDGYFGNQHPVGFCKLCNTVHKRGEAVTAFETDFYERIRTDDEYRERIQALKGKTLGCFCKPASCHGDVIAEYLNDLGTCDVCKKENIEVEFDLDVYLCRPCRTALYTQGKENPSPSFICSCCSQPIPEPSGQNRYFQLCDMCINCSILGYDPTKVIGIVGSRKRDTSADYQLCLKAFRGIYHLGDTIVSGGCPKGGDAFAEQIARDFDIPIKIHHPDWKKHGRSAGFVRNIDIAKDADVLIAVVASDRRGGTEDTIQKFGDKKPLAIVHSDDIIREGFEKPSLFEGLDQKEAPSSPSNRTHIYYCAKCGNVAIEPVPSMPRSDLCESCRDDVQSKDVHAFAKVSSEEGTDNWE